MRKDIINIILKMQSALIIDYVLQFTMEYIMCV